jgi:hypothetical protein
MANYAKPLARFGLRGAFSIHNLFIWACSNIICGMTKNNFYISLGVWLLLIPLLGIPNVWRGRLVMLTGVLLIVHAAWPVLVKKISQKPRIKKGKIAEPIISEPSIVENPTPPPDLPTQP